MFGRYLVELLGKTSVIVSLVQRFRMRTEEMLLLSFWNVHVVSQKNEFLDAIMQGQIQKLKSAVGSEMDVALCHTQPLPGAP